MAANQFGKVSVGITANTGGLTAGLNRAGNELRTFTRISDRLGRIQLATGFTALATAAGLAVRAISSVGRAINSTVQAASSLVEQQNRVNVIFGDSAKAVSQFAQSTAEIGFSTTEALKAAGTFGTLFDNIGLTTEASAQMSINLVRLTSDMASFNEVSIEEALRAMRSALVGEIEPIRRLGVMLSDATLRQKAFDMGLTDTVSKTLPPAIKLQAAYAAIIDQTVKQQGDFLRTSETLANQQKQLGANFENLKTTIGQAFTPIFLSIVNGINDNIANLKVLAQVFVETFTTATAGIFEAKTASESFAMIIRALAGGINVLNGFFQLLYGFSQDVKRGFLNVAGGIYAFLGGFMDFFGETVNRIEEFNRMLIFGLTLPLQGLLIIAAQAADALGARGLAGVLRRDAEAMRDIIRSSTGLGDAIKEAGQGAAFFTDLSEQSFAMAEEAGREAGTAFRNGMKNITDPLAGYDAALFAEKVKAGLQGMIPVFGEIGQQLGKAAGEEIAASTKQLSAIVVDSSTGEAFRNAILRGADPRLAQSADQKIIDNTGRAADGIAALPGDLSAAIGAQFAAASVSV